MQENYLYFIKDEFFEKYDYMDISKNIKIDEDGNETRRPCYYAFKENNILWMIPISHQVEKYEDEFAKSKNRYGFCDTLDFAYIKGNKNAVLIQNMIPIAEKYIDKIYTYHNTNRPITINDRTKSRINAKVRKVLRLTRRGKKLTFTPILELEEEILVDLSTQEVTATSDQTEKE